MTVDFIYIGLGRSGSTYLYEQIGALPDVNVPKIKELNYFNDNFEKGKKWYLSKFPQISKKGVKSGEFSNKYIYDEKCARRIKSQFPDVKIIAVIRNPFDYIVSVYRYRIRAGELKTDTSFSDALNLQKDILYRCEYSRMLKPYIDAFGDRLYIGLFDELSRDPNNFVKAICSFIDVECNSELSKEKVNQERGVRHPFLTNSARWLTDKLREYELLSLLQLLKNSNMLRKLLFGGKMVPVVQPKELEPIVSHINREIAKTEKLLHLSLDHWKR